MDQEFVLLNIAVLGASALQSATGIGFGVIAGPILLVLLSDGSAIQVSIALNLLIAVILAPSLRHKLDRMMLKNLVIGIAVGSPLGLLIFLSMDIISLKVTAGIGVLLTLSFVVSGNRLRRAKPSAAPFEQISLGVIAGVMGVCLAMPGPIPAAWMSARAFDKETIRSTILAMFIIAYAIAMGLQFAGAGIGADTLTLSASLAPSTVVGILLGNFASSHITEKAFRGILLTILVTTAMILFSSLV